ncbi:hypothetical protein TNIN_351971 [Trichonephila inaurata madagascariensis]|uniref:Uncharacterized protein n=1 Tax=Trichonephila inaurata madagascariensis TaxID=2747483 RepID=A0A8X6XLI5_9ARAC|nr:hypothetical protein TNIN_351971 [Trichonephila inaurata madagascariensis]
MILLSTYEEKLHRSWTHLDVNFQANCWDSWTRVIQFVTDLRRQEVEMLKAIPVKQINNLNSIGKCLEFRFGEGHLVYIYGPKKTWNRY